MTGAPSAKKILIVEDDPDITTFLETLLRDNGYETVSAADGQAGLDMLKTDPPDLVTLDISLPEKSGVRFYREVKEFPDTAKIPIIIVTGVTGWGRRPEDFEKFISSRKQVPPPEGFIAKPIEEDELLSKVKELLG